MIKLFKVNKMTIESDRDSVCMGDDMSRHNVFSDFPEKTKMSKLISELMKAHTIAKHIVNGEMVMALSNSRYTQDDKVIPLTKGKILLQSEAGEVFFKDIKNRVFFDKESFEKKCEK